MQVVLKPHPSSPTTAIDRVEVEVERGSEGDLKLTYRVFGDLDRVLLPAFVEAPGRTDELWRHTCFEVFLQPVGGDGYVEFNFATSLQWATYRFDDYREGMRNAAIEPWAMQGLIPPSALELSIDVAPGRFARPDLPAPDWRLGLTAVIEEVDGTISYWALSHPSDTPDFHNALSFTLDLPAPEPELRPAPMKFGIDRLLSDPALQAELKGRRVALLAHPASVTADLTHSIDALAALPDITLTAAFGPQHGMKGDLQDNMMETPDETDPVHGIPVFSLYGEVRRPSGQSMTTFDVILIDLQDVGCRIYTFVTTLLYVLEAAAEHGKTVWVLDRPNPAGRPVEGLTLRPGWESFVGAGPMPMRHGLTLGEMGLWFIDHFGLKVDYRVIAMEGWQPEQGPGYGWPLGERSWINPSPNAPNVSMVRAYAGTVMLEGATLSEGRGTTRPLELFGAPDIVARDVIAEMQRLAPEWLRGCILRDCWFQPTFHKHVGELCNGVQIHVDDPHYDHAAFKPWRVQALAFKAVRNLYPDYDLWRDFPYEYAFGKLPIDTINGGPALREWVDDRAATPDDLDALTLPDEAAWEEARKPFLLY